MIRKPSYRYYCEYCKKSGGHGGHMKNHERSCTGNPNRVCKGCQMCGNIQAPMPDLIAALGNGDDEGVKRLREASNNCPFCMLAAIRQSGLQKPWQSEEDRGFSVNFDFKKEKASFFDDYNSAMAESDYHFNEYL